VIESTRRATTKWYRNILRLVVKGRCQCGWVGGCGCLFSIIHPPTRLVEKTLSERERRNDKDGRRAEVR